MYLNSCAGEFLNHARTTACELVAGRAISTPCAESEDCTSTITRMESVDHAPFVTRDELQSVVDAMVRLESRLVDIASTHDVQDRGLRNLKGAATRSRSDPIIVVNIPPALFGMALVLAVVSSMWDGMKFLLGLLWPLHLLVKLMEILEGLIEFRTNPDQ